MALTYFDLYADAYRRGVMSEGQLVTAVKLGRITLPQAFEIRDTGGKCGALWVPPVEEAPAPAPTPEPVPTPPDPAPTTPEAPATGDGTASANDGTGTASPTPQAPAQDGAEGDAETTSP